MTQAYMKQSIMLLISSIAVGTFAASAVADDKKSVNDDAVPGIIQDALAAEHGVSPNSIEVKSKKGVVTLSGSVQNIFAKRRAVRVAQTVKGVRSVIDQITVAKSDRTDTQIRMDVLQALQRDPATSAWEVLAAVDNGAVQLRGTVDSIHERNLAETVACSVNGVRKITNRIDVEYDADRDDEAIEREIERALHWDALVDDALIDVQVSNDQVGLSGIVGSAAEKQRATMIASVTGVQGVNTDLLKVESWARDKRFRTRKYVDKSDDEVKQAIQAAFGYAPRVPADKVGVTVDNGIVTLGGMVDNVKSKRAAARVARNTVGVWRVRNHLKVKPESHSDQDIATWIRDRLTHDPFTERYEVAVTVDDGTARLTGSVDTYFEKMHADELAAEVAGVTHVDNNLIVDAQHDIFTYNPYVDTALYPYDYDWYVYPSSFATTESDAQIRADVRDELYWSPFVDGGDITIRVDAGVATLTGTVGTLSERSVATEEAFEAGAVAVDNDLLVAYGPTVYQP